MNFWRVYGNQGRWIFIQSTSSAITCLLHQATQNTAPRIGSWKGIDILLSCGDDLDVEFPNWNQSMFVAWVYGNQGRWIFIQSTSSAITCLLHQATQNTAPMSYGPRKSCVACTLYIPTHKISYVPVGSFISPGNAPEATSGFLGSNRPLEAAYMLPETALKFPGAREPPGPAQESYGPRKSCVACTLYIPTHKISYVPVGSFISTHDFLGPYDSWAAHMFQGQFLKSLRQSR
jgi:hypothetical protein